MSTLELELLIAEGTVPARFYSAAASRSTGSRSSESAPPFFRLFARLPSGMPAQSNEFKFLVLAAKNAKVAKGGAGISSRDVREVREVF